MNKITMIWSESGGETKSTLAVHLAAALAIKGQSVALVDGDPQGTATAHLGLKDGDYGDCVGTGGLFKGRKTNTVLEYHPPEGRRNTEPFWFSPSTPDLYGLRASNKTIDSPLETALRAIPVDFVIIDCGPGFDCLTESFLRASDEVLVPVRAQATKGLNGIERVKDVIELIRPTNPNIELAGIVLSEVGGGSQLSKDVQKWLRIHEKQMTYKATVRRSIRLAEACYLGRTVFDHCGRRNGPSGDYLRVADEFLRRTRKARKSA